MSEPMPSGIPQSNDRAPTASNTPPAETSRVTTASPPERNAECSAESKAESREIRAYIHTTISDRRKSVFHIAGIAFWLVVWLIICFPFLSGAPLRDGMFFTLVSLALPALIFPLVMILIKRENGKSTQRTIAKIEAMDDVRLIGSLMEMLDIDSVPVRNAAKARLAQLLPRLQASDTELITPLQRKRLHSFLAEHLCNFAYRDVRELGAKGIRQRKTEFQVAILVAYEKIGDATCLPAVRSLARATVHSKSVPLEVSEAARRCLVFLEPLAAQKRASKQLLRASTAPAVLPDTLLRPVMNSTTGEDSASLLRAANETASSPAASGQGEA